MGYRREAKCGQVDYRRATLDFRQEFYCNDILTLLQEEMTGLSRDGTAGNSPAFILQRGATAWSLKRDGMPSSVSPNCEVTYHKGNAGTGVTALRSAGASNRSAATKKCERNRHETNHHSAVRHAGAQLVLRTGVRSGHAYDRLHYFPDRQAQQRRDGSAARHRALARCSQRQGRHQGRLEDL